jgi:serine/threonine-protein kinase
VRIGRYVIHDEIAAGGMATVHLGRLVGQAGFARTVAVKRLLPQLARDPDFVSSFVDEARLAARVIHPNVVPTLDVVVEDHETIVVMEYVHGASLARLLRDGRPPLGVTLTILTQVLAGLHAAHEATGPRGRPLRLVHRDVSPQNVMVGVDGSARLLDFGVAKAAWRIQQTRQAIVKGKLAYMAPEQLEAKAIDRRADVFGASIILWEALTGARLFGGTPEETRALLLSGSAPRPSSVVDGLPPELDRIVVRGLARDPEARFATALEMAAALEAIGLPSTTREVSAWVASRAGDELARRSALLVRLDEETTGSVDGPVGPMIEAAALRERRQEEATAVGPPKAVAPPPSTPAEGPARRRRSLLPAVLLLAVAGAGAVAVVARSGRGPRDARPTAPSAAPDAVTISVVGRSASPPDVPPALDSAVPAKTAGARPAGASSRSHPRSTVPSELSSPAPRPPRPPDCDPPYTVGPEGVRRYRAECL